MNTYKSHSPSYSGKQVNWFKIFSIGIISIILLLATVLFFQVFSVKSVAQTQAMVSTDKTTLELGNISMKNGIKKMKYSFVNSSDQPIKLTQLFTSCMCTKAKLIVDGKESIYAGMQGHGGGLGPINPNLSLNPNQKAELEVEFDPNAHGPQGVGPINRTVTVETNSTSTPQFLFYFNGVVTKE